jgi:nucleoid DNA-binding protein
MLLLTFKHIIADFVLQTAWMAHGKDQKHGWALPLLVHCLVHLAVALPLILIVAPKFWFVALIDFAIRTAFHEILKALKRGEVVTIRDFGRWEVRERAERDRFNVNSGEVCRSAPRQVIKFAVARSDPLANVRDDPFQQPEKFDSAEHLIGWLTTAADSIKRWDERQRAIAAWKNTESLRSTLLVKTMPRVRW